MDLSQIEATLQSEDLQERIVAVKALWQCDTDVAVPRLVAQLKDPEFLVRSFIAMGLGTHQTTEAFAALLEMVKFDPDPNVRAEASNSLSLYGPISRSHLVSIFFQDDHWLVRRSILAALTEMDSPEELFEVCVCGLAGEDATVREASATCLSKLVGTSRETEALQALLNHTSNPAWRLRAQVARSLTLFAGPAAKAALQKLAKDEDRRVVGATLEASV
ncbi:HEAT repeat domain-containing protein [Synechococcus sp. PCC 7336]|uniref:HEAT repeat domain-containing protein n=1 Tax=Synechococcus sp. PCC 7336 TaxID=195250 RepID=UPI00034C0EAB|nr:HEAT repeat domain-containing protein [Synechococcus sp. PCC 7336]